MHNLLTIETYLENGKISLPENFNIQKKCKVIVTFMEDEQDDHINEMAASEMAIIQSMTGFAKEILNDPAEDVWNDL